MATMVLENVEVMAAAYRTVEPHPRTAEFHAMWAAHITALLEQARPDIDAAAVGGLLFGIFGTDYAVTAARAGEGERLRAAVRQLVQSVVSR